MSLLDATVVSHPTCMLVRRLGREEPCSSECAFWEDGGAVLPAGCALERILGEGDWPVELAARWLRIRDRVGSAADWQPAGFFSTLLG